jgi:LysM repeat protein
MKQFVILCIVFLAGSLTTQGAVKDSIGTKVKNGKVFIMHRVEKGEGLYSISKRYGVSLKRLIDDLGRDELKAGEVILIPTGRKAPMEEKVVKNYFSGNRKKNQAKDNEDKGEQTTTFANIHVVKQGETLYGISRKYNTTVDVLVSLNGLKAEPIKVGQKLVVPGNNNSEEQVTAEEPKKDPEIRSTVKNEKLRPAVTKSESTERTTTGNYVKRVEKVSKYDIEKVIEEGEVSLAPVEEELVNSQNLAYHHEAPVGTVLLVTNLSNNQAVFVKVVGPCKADLEKGLVAQLTKSAYNQIGYQPGNRVEISYAR